MGGIYRAEVYCDACMERIENTLRSEGAIRPPEIYPDSDAWPCVAPASETDRPNLCGGGKACPNYSAEHESAPILEETLTTDGLDWLHRQILRFLCFGEGRAEVIAGWWNHWKRDLRTGLTESERHALDCLPNLRWRVAKRAECLIHDLRTEGHSFLQLGPDIVVQNRPAILSILRDAFSGETQGDLWQLSLCRSSLLVFGVYEPFRD
jgi:hypothetical protein